VRPLPGQQWERLRLARLAFPLPVPLWRPGAGLVRPFRSPGPAGFQRVRTSSVLLRLAAARQLWPPQEVKPEEVESQPGQQQQARRQLERQPLARPREPPPALEWLEPSPPILLQVRYWLWLLPWLVLPLRERIWLQAAMHSSPFRSSFAARPRGQRPGPGYPVPGQK